MFAFVPEFYINVIPILLDTVMDFSFHDLSVQNDLTGNIIKKKTLDLGFFTFFFSISMMFIR